VDEVGHLLAHRQVASSPAPSVRTELRTGDLLRAAGVVQVPEEVQRSGVGFAGLDQ
jgi:hypothetical protein